MKTWCKLCLIIDGILVIQAAILGYMYYMGFMGAGYPKLSFLAITLLLFGAVGAAVLLLKNKIKAANQSEKAEIAASRIKYSSEVFMHLLSRQKRVDTTPFDQELLIGNPNASVKILMAASLGCGPCKEGFEKAMQLVTSYSQNVNLVIRLRSDGGKKNGEATLSIALVEYWQQHIYGKADASDRTEQLIRDWYRFKDLKEFSAQYSLDKNKRNKGGSEQLADLHTQWMERENISATPTFFIDGYRLPRIYQLDDLMGIIPSLIDYFGKLEIKQKTFL